MSQIIANMGDQQPDQKERRESPTLRVPAAERAEDQGTGTGPVVAMGGMGWLNREVTIASSCNADKGLIPFLAHGTIDMQSSSTCNKEVTHG